jgi:hypothetical protein
VGCPYRKAGLDLSYRAAAWRENHDTWQGEEWINRSGANVWGFMTVDVQRGMLFVPLGTPSPDFYGGDRKGSNLYGSSLVALDVATGQRCQHDLSSSALGVNCRHPDEGSNHSNKRSRWPRLWFSENHKPGGSTTSTLILYLRRSSVNWIVGLSGPRINGALTFSAAAWQTPRKMPKCLCVQRDPDLR